MTEKTVSLAGTEQCLFITCLRKRMNHQSAMIMRQSLAEYSITYIIISKNTERRLFNYFHCMLYKNTPDTKKAHNMPITYRNPFMRYFTSRLIPKSAFNKFACSVLSSKDKIQHYTALSS